VYISLQSLWVHVVISNKGWAMIVTPQVISLQSLWVHVVISNKGWAMIVTPQVCVNIVLQSERQAGVMFL